jgi:hypothetical protein
VFVVGCVEGDCSYITGNLWARQCVNHVKEILAETGLEPERLEMYNIPGPNGAGFAAAAAEFTERIKALGASPAKRPGAQPQEDARAALGNIALSDNDPHAVTLEEGHAQ